MGVYMEEGRSERERDERWNHGSRETFGFPR